MVDEITRQRGEEQGRFGKAEVAYSPRVQAILLAQPLNPLVKLDFHPYRDSSQRGAGERSTS